MSLGTSREKLGLPPDPAFLYLHTDLPLNPVL